MPNDSHYEIISILFAILIYVTITVCIIVYLSHPKKPIKVGWHKLITYTHCSQKPLNRPLRDAFTFLGIGFMSPTDITNLALQHGPEPHKIIYIPCSYNNSDTDIQGYFKNDIPSKTDLVVEWITAAVLGCNKLCSKNGLWSVLESTYGRQNAAKITPESWVIPAQTPGINRLSANATKTNIIEKTPPVLIFKKNIQGKQGLLLTNSQAEILKLIGSAAGPNDKYSVAQRYLEQPYLIHGRKLNIRLYVLVVISELVSSWWLYNAGKCIYTNRRYEPLPPNTIIMSGAGNMELLEQHFTSLNLDPINAYYVEQCPESLEELGEYMQHHGENWQRIWQKIQLGLQKVAQAYTGKLTAYPGSTAYQIFGVDYLLTRVTRKGDEPTEIMPYLLEFNKGPEMKFKSPKDPELKQGLQQDILELVLGNKTGKWLSLNSVNKSKT